MFLRLLLALSIASTLWTGMFAWIGAARSGTREGTEFLQQGSVANTRHNLRQRQLAPGGPTGGIMDAVRNDYEEVCVYCHTPHGANTQIQAPLWNRTVRTTAYSLYTSPSLSQTGTQPGPASLTCLSCHDGQTAVDAIINMPGSGKYNAGMSKDPSPELTKTFLDAWKPDDDAYDHWALKDNGTECLGCHSPGGLQGAQDFTAGAIGTQLGNDHPIGVKLPVGDDWNVSNAVFSTVRYFDANGNGRPDKEEIRFYDSGDGYEVECASCHDPHGVPGAGGFLPNFLRVTAQGSSICFTCHTK